jgi:hypothetical protein
VPSSAELCPRKTCFFVIRGSHVERASINTSVIAQELSPSFAHTYVGPEVVPRHSNGIRKDHRPTRRGLVRSSVSNRINARHHSRSEREGLLGPSGDAKRDERARMSHPDRSVLAPFVRRPPWLLLTTRRRLTRKPTTSRRVSSRLGTLTVTMSSPRMGQTGRTAQGSTGSSRIAI